MYLRKSKNSDHSFFMRLALQQAKKNLGNTKDNPSVGCVIVKNNYVISSGATGINGIPHAEENAINTIKKNIKNSDLYVSLEPCSHYGKTPPCVNNIINNNIKRVFFSIKDPDIRSYNKSTKLFKKNKIFTKNGFLYTETKNFYRSYFAYKNTRLPFVTGKIAVSKDFYTKNTSQKWITNEYSRGRVHLLRSSHDSILTSIKTVVDDNPFLTCRIHGLENTSPTRIILDKKLKIYLSSNIVKSAKKIHTIIFYNKIDKKKILKLKNLNLRLIRTDLNKAGNFNLRNILLKIKDIGFSRIFLESGIELTSNFLKEDLVNDFKLFISSQKIGKRGANNFQKCVNLFLKNKNFNDEKINLLGDKLISYKIK